MSDNVVLSCLDQRQTRSTVQLNPCMSFLTAREFYVVISYYLNHREQVEEYLREQQAKADRVRRTIESTPLNVARRGLRERLEARWAAQHQNSGSNQHE
jgi:hypothetical protein